MGADDSSVSSGILFFWNKKQFSVCRTLLMYLRWRSQITSSSVYVCDVNFIYQRWRLVSTCFSVPQREMPAEWTQIGFPRRDESSPLPSVFRSPRCGSCDSTCPTWPHCGVYSTSAYRLTGEVCAASKLAKWPRVAKPEDRGDRNFSEQL